MSTTESSSLSTFNPDYKTILLQLDPQSQSQSAFIQTHPHLSSRLNLSNTALYLPITTLPDALKVFSLKGPTSTVVLVTNLALAWPEHQKLREKMVQWVGMGGEIFFFPFSFAAFRSEDEDEESRNVQLERIFEMVSLPWTVGRVIRGSYAINEEIKSLPNWSWKRLAYVYEMEALCLVGVADHQAVYRPCAWNEGLEEEEEEEEEEDEGDGKQTAVAWTDYWDGKVGFVGDLGDSVESAEALGAIMLMRLRE